MPTSQSLSTSHSHSSTAQDVQTGVSDGALIDHLRSCSDACSARCVGRLRSELDTVQMTLTSGTGERGPVRGEAWRGGPE